MEFYPINCDIFYRENIGALRWGAIALGFTGALLIVRPSRDVFNWTTLMPIGAIFCYAPLTSSSKLMSIMSGHQTWMENVLLGFIWFISFVHPKFYSKIAEKEVCFQWKWIEKLFMSKKQWLTTHPQSIPLSLFCWVKSIEIFSLFLTHLHSFQIKSFQLIYRCSCIARQVINVHFSTTFIKTCLQCVMTKWIGLSLIHIWRCRRRLRCRSRWSPYH